LARGLSNRANIAAAMLLLHPEALAGAVLLRAMMPLSDPAPADLSGRPVLMLSGAADPIVPGDNAAGLAALLAAAGARVEHAVLPGGHGLSQADVTRIEAWMTREAPLP
jgi:phospholipase/carboxylesterase